MGVGLETGVGVELEIGVGIGLETGVGVELETGVGGVGVGSEIGVGGLVWDGLVQWFSVVYELWTDQRKWRWDSVPRCWASMSLVVDDVRGAVRHGVTEARSRWEGGRCKTVRRKDGSWKRRGIGARWEWVGQWSWLRVRREVGEREAVEWLLLVSADCDRSWRDWSMSDCCVTARRRREGGHGVGVGWGDSNVWEQRRSLRDRSSIKSVHCRTSPRRAWKLHPSPLQIKTCIDS